MCSSMLSGMLWGCLFCLLAGKCTWLIWHCVYLIFIEPSLKLTAKEREGRTPVRKWSENKLMQLRHCFWLQQFAYNIATKREANIFLRKALHFNFQKFQSNLGAQAPLISNNETCWESSKLVSVPETFGWSSICNLFSFTVSELAGIFQSLKNRTLRHCCGLKCIKMITSDI